MMGRSFCRTGVVQKLEDEADLWLGALVAAKRRIGRTPAARLEWLLRFADIVEPQRLAELADKQIADLEAEAYVFIDNLEAASSGARAPKLDRETLMGVALRIKQGLTNLVDGKSWAFHVAPFRRYVSRLRKGGLIISGYSAENWEPAFLMSTADLLVGHGARIHRCARSVCSRLFLRRKGGLYCSKACSQRERTARMQGKLGREGWSERRHSYYEQKIQKLYGNAVKVRRHKAKGENQ